LHCGCPIIRSESFETARSFPGRSLEKMALGDPEKFTVEIRKKNAKPVFIDTLLNAYVILQWLLRCAGD